MRVLGITETCDLGSLYLRLIEEGHEVKVAVSEPLAEGTMKGLVPRVANWPDELEWVRDGTILFESVSEGFGERQDALRADGYHVIGGSAFGDRLENDRAFAQTLLGELGFPTGHVWEFDQPAAAIAHIEQRPSRYVLKFSGASDGTAHNYLGQLDDGADVGAVLRATPLNEGARFILMDYIAGIEIGVGAYFDGNRFLRPACLDWEHKRFFAGDMGELTGEMGTVATFEGSDVFFERTLLKIEPHLRGRGHVGYVNLNTIVNEEAIWPLEFTCRFGYPGFAVLEPLQDIGWGALFERMLAGDGGELPVRSGYSTGIVLTTPPFPYTRKQVAEPVGLPILFDEPPSTEDQRHQHFGEVGLNDGVLATAGLYGWTMVVTGTGERVEESGASAYARIGNIVVPNGRYRLDIGARVPDQITTLRAMGLIQ